MKKNFLIIFFSLIFLLGGFFLVINSGKNETIEKIKSVNIAGKEVKIDLAMTAEERRQGLSGRETLDENAGMLFVFPHDDTHSFWMKDMKFPIDIVWLDKNLKVIYLKENATPESYPESFFPNKEAKYVLEISAGFVERNNLKIEDQAIFTY